jgi:hypothetical protein
MSTLRMEMMQLMRAMSTLVWAMLMQHRGRMGMWDMRDAAVHAMLAMMEMMMVVAAVPVCMLLPGMMAMVWMMGCAMVVMGMCWMLNGREEMCVCKEGMQTQGEGWMDGGGGEEERWMFVGGMGMR